MLSRGAPQMDVFLLISKSRNWSGAFSFHSGSSSYGRSQRKQPVPLWFHFPTTILSDPCEHNWTVKAGCFPATGHDTKNPGRHLIAQRAQSGARPLLRVAQLLVKPRLGSWAVDVEEGGGRAIIKAICMRAACLALLVLRPETQIGSHEASRAT